MRLYVFYRHKTSIKQDFQKKEKDLITFMIRILNRNLTKKSEL